jgi:GxxExxY protein
LKTGLTRGSVGMTGNELTQIINCAYEVRRSLGAGFLEKVYENAHRIKMTKAGLSVKQQHPIKVFFEGEVVGDYIVDLWVEDRIIVELKAVQSLTKEHEIQLVNYLTATKVDTELLINFGSPSVQVRRKFREHKPNNNPVNLVKNLVNLV